MKENKNVVRLTESQLKQMIGESVKKVLSEMGTKAQNLYLQSLVGDNRYDNLSPQAANDKIQYLLQHRPKRKDIMKGPMTGAQLYALEQILEQISKMQLNDVDDSVVEFCINNSEKISTYVAMKVIKVFKEIIDLKKKNNEQRYNELIPDKKLTINHLYKLAMKDVNSENNSGEQTNTQPDVQTMATAKNESKIHKIVSESVKKVLNEMQNGEDIYNMEQWRIDGELNPYEGQLVSDEVVNELASSVPPTTWRHGYFQSGEAYDFDPNTYEDRFMTFQRVDSNIWKYLGLKPRMQVANSK